MRWSSSRFLDVTVVAALAAAGLSFSCGGDSTSGAGGGCPNDLPASCPSSVPSYKDEVALIIDRSCNPCHGVDTCDKSRPLATYAQVVAQTGVLDQVYGCRMPPPAGANDGACTVNVGALPEADRLKLLTWLVCKEPNN